MRNTNTIVVGGRIIMAKRTPEQIEENRDRILAKARRIRVLRAARELKESGLLPHDAGSQFAGWQGTNETHHALPNGRRVKSSDEKFQEFLALNRSEVIASKQTF